jgi:hypothetical protein
MAPLGALLLLNTYGVGACFPTPFFWPIYQHKGGDTVAKLNKAEKFVKRILDEKFGFYIKRGLPYDREEASHQVYWAICTKLGNPDHWPPEYGKAYQDAFKY